MYYSSGSLTRNLLALCLAMLLIAANGPASAKGKVDICHVDDEGNVLTLNISVKAEAAHLRHGDYSPLTFYLDSDGDSYGDPAITATGCLAPAGYVDNAGDCNDSEPLAWTGAEEILNDGVDNDCDPATPDVIVADCPCTDIYVQARRVWETLQNANWSPSLFDGTGNTFCTDSFFTNPLYRAEDISLTREAFGPAGFGCYAIVRQDDRDTGGGTSILFNQLIPYDTNQAVQDAEIAACRTLLLDTCSP